MESNGTFELRPGVTNPGLWYPERPPQAEWSRIRKVVLQRDNNTCRACGYQSAKYMNLHHFEETGKNEPDNLITMCVACHAVLHMGRNLDLKTIEIWQSPLSQVELVRKTREGIRDDRSLQDINKEFKLKRGPYAPDSIEYANSLLQAIGEAPRASLSKPLCAVFVAFKQWQLT